MFTSPSSCRRQVVACKELRGIPWVWSYADLLGSFSALSSTAGGSSTQLVGYLGSKKWVRIATTVSGATTGGVYGAAAILSHARHNDPQTTQE